MAKYCFLPLYFIVLDFVCLNIAFWGVVVVAISATILVAVWSKSDAKKDVAVSKKQMKPRLSSCRVFHRRVCVKSDNLSGR